MLSWNFQMSSPSSHCCSTYSAAVPKVCYHRPRAVPICLCTVLMGSSCWALNLEWSVGLLVVRVLVVVGLAWC